MKLHLKYWFLQIPGYLIAVGILSILHRFMDFPFFVDVLLLIILFLKDLFLFPVVKHSYSGDGLSPRERLIGLTCTVSGELNPEGLVRCGGELWRASITEESSIRYVPGGNEVIIRRVEGLTLFVEPVETKSHIQ